MNTKASSQLVKVIAVFVGLVLMGVGLTVGSQFIPGSFEQSVLINIGSAILGGSLAFFLIEAFRIEREH
jgi:hypothetical protein